MIVFPEGQNGMTHHYLFDVFLTSDILSCQSLNCSKAHVDSNMVSFGLNGIYSKMQSTLLWQWSLEVMNRHSFSKIIRKLSGLKCKHKNAIYTSFMFKIFPEMF